MQGHWSKNLRCTSLCIFLPALWDNKLQIRKLRLRETALPTTCKCQGQNVQLSCPLTLSLFHLTPCLLGTPSLKFQECWLILHRPHDLWSCSQIPVPDSPTTAALPCPAQVGLEARMTGWQFSQGPHRERRESVPLTSMFQSALVRTSRRLTFSFWALSFLFFVFKL